VTDHLGPGTAREVDVRGTGSRVDFLSYPVTEHLESAWNALERLEPALAALGRRTMAGVLASMLGKTALTVSGRDPVRLLRSCPTAYRGAVSYGERTVEFPAERRAVMTYRHDFMPASFHAAVLLAGLQASTALRPRVMGQQDGPLDSSYQIAWE